MVSRVFLFPTSRGEDVGNGREEVTHYKYRIQVGDEYTYRDSPYTLDLLVQCLLDQGPDSSRARAQAAVDRLLAKAKGEEVAELPPRRPPVPGPGYSDHGRGGLPAGAEAGGRVAQGMNHLD